MCKELKAARKIVNRAVNRGFRVSVWDGEAWAIRRCKSPDKLCKALASTDSDLLVLHSDDGKPIGSILLVWGNGPEELVCDYTLSATIEEIVNGREIAEAA